jgi:RHS repeat-associated protein
VTTASGRIARYTDENRAPAGLKPNTASRSKWPAFTNLSALINTNYATDYTYDSSTQTQLLSVTRKFTDPDLGLQTAITKYEYNDASNPGLVTRIIPPRGNTGPTPDYTFATTMAYYSSGSPAGMLQSSTDADGNQTTYTYDAAGRRLTMVDPNGNASGGVPGDHTWSYTYDAEDRLLTQVAPAPVHGGTALTTTFQYDAVGNRTAVIDANGQVTVYLYDVRDQLTEVHQSPNSWTNPAVAPSPLYATQYVYDNLGNLTRMIRAANDPTANRAIDYLYDGSRRLRQEVQYPSWPLITPTLTTTYAYDGNGNRTSLVDPLGQTTTFSFDALNRLTGISYSDGLTPNVSYTYDANGNRATMVDGTGTTSYSYDEMDRLQSVTSPGPSTVGYRYDLDGNRTKLLYPDATAVTYSFDKASRLGSLTDWATRSTSYTYLPDGHVQQVTNVNGTVSQYSYDNAQRLSQVLNKQSGGTVIDQHTYTLDSVGTRTQVAETLAQVGGGQITPITTYGYDKLYELTADGGTSYAYDLVGNRLTMASTSYSYDKADRITAAGATSYTVNANGNVTARGSDSFAYDQANRLKSATVSGTTTTNAFDGDGKRATQTVGSGPTATYINDTKRALPVVLSDGTLKYVWGLGLLYAVDGSGNLSVYHTDALGSIRALTDGSTTLIATYRTDVWGNPTATQGSSTQPFRFAGEQLDSDGFVYLRARFYEPATGRFPQRDQLFGDTRMPVSLNRLQYALSGPVSRADPGGLSSSRVLSFGEAFGDVSAPVAPVSFPARRALLSFGLLEGILQLPSRGYLDFNGTVVSSIGIGLAAGFQVDARGHIYLCFGPALGQPQISGSIQASASNPSPDSISVAVQSTSPLISGQVGITVDANGAAYFSEVGKGFGQGISISGYYTTPPLPFSLPTPQ